MMMMVPDVALGVLLQDKDTCVEDSLFLHVANACYYIGLLRQLDMRTVVDLRDTIKVFPLREVWDAEPIFYTFCWCCLSHPVSMINESPTRYEWSAASSSLECMCCPWTALVTR
jgi:hypothetical protein